MAGLREEGSLCGLTTLRLPELQKECNMLSQEVQPSLLQANGVLHAVIIALCMAAMFTVRWAADADAPDTACQVC